MDKAINRRSVGREKPFGLVKLFSGVIYRAGDVLERVKVRLEEVYSLIEFESEAIPFDSTDYYNPEMGSPLFRRFYAFSGLISPEELVGIKLMSNRIEDEFAIEGKRLFNIDPGYLSEGNVVIATTKNYYHRIPLQNGIYAHMEYIIKRKKIIPLEWTYPDFKKPAYLHFFERLRLSYRKKEIQ